MPDLPIDDGSGGATATRTGPEPHRRPRWVRATAMVVGAVVVVFVLLKLFGVDVGDHGPGMHGGGGGSAITVAGHGGPGGDHGRQP